MEPYIGSLNPFSLATSFFLLFLRAWCLPLGTEFFLLFVTLPFGAGFVLLCLIFFCQLLDQCPSSLWIIVWPPCGAWSVFRWDQGSFWRWTMYRTHDQFSLWKIVITCRGNCVWHQSVTKCLWGRNSSHSKARFCQEAYFYVKLIEQFSDLLISRLERLCWSVLGHCNITTGHWCDTWVLSLSKLWWSMYNKVAPLQMSSTLKCFQTSGKFVQFLG